MTLGPDTHPQVPLDVSPTSSHRDGTTIRVGCSGWDYRDWKGTVYPASLAREDWFATYATWFDTVEINNTFYRLPERETVDRWAAQAPPGFLYSIKLGQFGSHRMKLRDARRWLPNHLDRVERLGSSRGPTLVQLPPRWHRNVGRLDEFLAATPPDSRWAIELRDPSWLHEDTYSVLRDHDAALCIHDLLPNHPWILTSSWSYLRFHGPHASTDPYHGAYTGRRLWRVADRLGEWVDAGIAVFAYFNNDFEGHAVRDARWLRNRMSRAFPV